jgi:multiple sugar transport system permease protein
MTSTAKSLNSSEHEQEAVRLARRARIRKLAYYTADYGLMTLLAAFFIFPIVVMLVASVKPERIVTDDLDTINAFVPRQFTFENYSCPDYREDSSDCSGNPGVFERQPFGRFLFNSVFITSITVICGLFVNSMAAFALSRLRWRGSGVVLGIVVALIIIPFESIAVPLLLLVNHLPWFDGRTSWINSYHVQIIPFVADAFSIFLFYQFFIGIPKDFDEAARVDGASGFMIYWRIILPLARPVFATVAILQFLFLWGAFLWPLMTIQKPEFRPLQVAMQEFFGQAPIQWGDIMAFASMITVPVLIVFLMFQKWFIQSVASSGVKG